MFVIGSACPSKSVISRCLFPPDVRVTDIYIYIYCYGTIIIIIIHYDITGVHTTQRIRVHVYTDAMHRKTIIAFPPIDEITDSAVIRAGGAGKGGKKQKKPNKNGRGKKSRELHNFYNREILNDGRSGESECAAVAAAEIRRVCLCVYTMVRHSNGVRRVFNDPGSNRPEI